ncbi:MAG: hypothetical protein KC503_29725 [Myxococcales bacterium]|nr:hypothetical protein [Myxococcales bacterium]
MAAAAGCTRWGFSPRASTGTDTDGAVEGDAFTVSPPDSDTLVVPSDQSIGDAPWPGYKLSAPTRFYRTANTLSFVWQCDGQIPGFDRYELCVSADATFPPADTRCLDPLDDIGLGRPDCGGGDLYHPVTVYQLAASTTYYLQLSVYDNTGEKYEAPLISDTTLAAPADRIKLYAGNYDPNAQWLLRLTPSTSNPHSGSEHLQYVSTKTGYQTLQYGNLGPITPPNLTADRLEGGHFEFYLDSPQPATVCVFLVGAADTASFCLPRGFAAVDGRKGYQRLQVPLSWFQWETAGTPLQPSEFGDWTKLIVGADWGKGTVYLDDISIYY